jgi:hypothetical protein
MTLRFALPLLLIAALGLGGCATYTDVRQHKNLDQDAGRIGSVVILPPEVSVELVAFGENERLPQKQDSLREELTTLAKGALAAKGLQVIEFDFAKADAEHPELAFAVTQCKEALANAKKSLYQKPVEEKNKSSFTESIGASANAIAEATGADALLVINYAGFEKSSGMVAKDVAAGVLLGVLTGTVAVAPSQGAAAEISLVAADSGNILWTNRKAAPALNSAVQKMVFAEFPKVQWRAQPQNEVANTEGSAPVPAENSVAEVPPVQPVAAPVESAAPQQ